MRPMKAVQHKLGRTSGNLSRPEVAIHLEISPSKVDADLRAAFRMTLKFLYIKLGLPAIIVSTVLMLSFIPGAAAAPDQSSPAGQFATAYNSMATADLLDEKGLRADAADLYTEALELFKKVSADYPQWQPAVVSFRIKYCREALQRLQGRGTDDGRQTTDGRRQTADDSLKRTTDAGRQTTDTGRQMADDSLKRTTDDGRQTTDDSLKRAPDSGQRAIDDKRQATENGKSAIRNPQSAILNLSPLNFKLQQAELKERGRDYAGALAMYTALLEEYPQELWALKGACRCYLRLERIDQARTLTRQALTLPLPDADLNLLAALVDCHDGHYRTAISLLRQAFKQNGAFWSPEAHVALGVALAATGALQEAQEEMKQALSLNPKLCDAFYNLARLSLRQKPDDHDTARVHYQNALRHGAAPDPELDKLLAE